MAEQQASSETFRFQAEVDQLLDLVIHSLYSHKEIFLRELISNASDALDRLKFRALTEPSLAGDPPLEIRIVPDAASSTLAIEDTGVGMTRDELVQGLGTIAHSGTRAFLEKARQSGGDPMSLIGQFGVGFYSAYLVADRVEVTSRAAGAEEAWTWRSDARGSFTVEPATRESRGTTVLMHLKPDEKEFLDEWKLRELVKHYSDFVSFPILLRVERRAGEGTTTELERINNASAVWLRPKSELTEEDYEEFYKHIAHDWEAPLARTHFTAEGLQQFTALLYIPRRPPLDLFLPDHRHGVRLYVQRVFIMDDCDALLPRWLRFARGIVDSNDLPLNVSRELLQDSRATHTIRKQITRKLLDLLEQVARERAEDYALLWERYGAVIKEGLHSAPEHRDRLAELVRFASSHGEGTTALADYVSRMPDGQEAIYYVIGESAAALAGSPHLEALRRRGYEVLYMTDPIDEWAVQALGEYKGKRVVSAMKADLPLGESEEERKTRADQQAQFDPLLARFREVLDERLEDVRLSARLSDSPVCLVMPEGAMHAHMERLLRVHNRKLPPVKRILEINPTHPIVDNLRQLHAREPQSDRLTDWIHLLYDQALLGEGSPPSDPQGFARRVSELLHQVSRAAVFG